MKLLGTLVLILCELSLLFMTLLFLPIILVMDKRKIASRNIDVKQLLKESTIDP